jgi:hypothetical protein
VTLKGQDWGPKEFKGYWTEIYRHEGDTWKKRLDMYNLTPAPPPTASPAPEPIGLLVDRSRDARLRVPLAGL